VETFVRELPDLVRAAATNWRSVIALMLLIAAAIIVALKVFRNRQLLAHLNQFPEKDRLQALQMELGVVKLRAGLSPEQWLKHKTNTYIFACVVIVCLMTTVVVVTFLTRQPSGSVAGTFAHVPEPLSDQSQHDSGKAATKHVPLPPVNLAGTWLATYVGGPLKVRIKRKMATRLSQF
jgi:hypothetical protein